MQTFKTDISLLMHKAIDVRLIEDKLLRCPFHNRTLYHAHPEVELLFIETGKGKRRIAGKWENFEDGDMVFLQSMVPHTWIVEADHRNPKAILLYIDPKTFGQAINGSGEFQGISRLLNNGPMARQIKGTAHSEISHKLLELVGKSGFEKVIGTLEVLHLIASAEETNNIISERLEVRTTERVDPMVVAVKFIRKNLSSQISTQVVADHVGMSCSAFCRLFRMRTGITFLGYLNSQRIQKACDELTSGNKSVAEIAELCGYNNLSHFCKTFRAHSGFTPLEFRNKSRR